MPKIAVPLYRGKPNKSAMCQYAISTMGKKYCEKDVIEEVKYLFDQTVEVTDVREAKKRVRKNASNQKTNGLTQPENIIEYKQESVAPCTEVKTPSQPLSLEKVEVVVEAVRKLEEVMGMVGKEGALFLLDEIDWPKEH